MNAEQIVLEIQAKLDGVEWHPGILEEIAQLLVDNGYRVRDKDDVDRGTSEELAQLRADYAETRLQPGSGRRGENWRVVVVYSDPRGGTWRGPWEEYEAALRRWRLEDGRAHARLIRIEERKS